MKVDANPTTHIIVKGAAQHNLKQIDLNIPKNKLVVFTGLSGSGKSSLAFDTIYAEGQRKYVESLSSYARQFLGIMQKPEVEAIEGLAPAISIEQKTTSHNPRSTVGTITEIYDYMRLLFARIGHPRCPNCGSEIAPQSIDQIAARAEVMIAQTTLGTPTKWLLLAPLVQDKRGEFSGLFENLRKKGIFRVRVDGRIISLDQDLVLIKTNRHTIEAVVDRMVVSPKMLSSKDNEFSSRLKQSLETALDLSGGWAMLMEVKDGGTDFPEQPQEFEEHLFSELFACPNCHTSFTTLEPRLFSFNTPHGACPACTGLGTLFKIDPSKVIAPDLTLSEGAIIPLASALSQDTWYARKAMSILEYYKVPNKTYWKNIPEKVQEILLYGSSKTFEVSGSNQQGRQVSFSFQPEGIIPELERRYEETNSDFMRNEISKYMQKQPCEACEGKRLKPEALAVTILNKNIHDLVEMSISDAFSWFRNLNEEIQSEESDKLAKAEKVIALSIVKEIVSRLDFLSAVGLEYLNMGREAATLAGGEAQRIRLASQIGTGLTGVLYVLDEPTIGLHPRDNRRLITTLKNLRDLGNTVIVVEHDQEVIESAEHIIDFGPRAGERGGQVVAQGTLAEIKENSQSITGKYLKGSKEISADSISKVINNLHQSLKIKHNTPSAGTLKLKGARAHNLKNVTVEFPLGNLVAVTGVSGSGKSTLVHDTLYPALKKALGETTHGEIQYDSLEGVSNISKTLLIDQSPIGRTPRSNPATYTKMFDEIRQIYAATREAQLKGFKPGRFSFNIKGGRCEACQGGGQVKISMQFLSDVYVTCDVCNGQRYNSETLEIKYKGLNISELLDLTVDEAIKLFASNRSVVKKLATLQAVGLGYIKLGQPAPTLSGGEAQRIKLAKELSIMSYGHTIYLLDEPTTGLHFEDVNLLMVVLKQLVKNNNTVIVIEHNTDVIRNADWIIDLGPEGGEGGGQIVSYGTPEQVRNAKQGYTYQFI